jgi:predicted solute-binding protein
VNDTIPRIGCVPYLNARPLVEGITYPIRELVPAKLGDAFQAGEFDVALLSSIDVITSLHPYAVDGISISSQGDVYSVVLAYHGDLKGIKKVVLDPASHTSNALLRIVLEDFHGIFPEYVQSLELNFLDLSLEAPTLLIGDRAINERKRTISRDVRFLDLGGEWFRSTGYPFVFALWSLRDCFTKKKEISNLLRSAKIVGLARRAEIAAREKDPEFAQHYLTVSIRYDLGVEEKAGLALFSEFLIKHKFLEKNQEIKYF